MQSSQEMQLQQPHLWCKQDCKSGPVINLTLRKKKKKTLPRSHPHLTATVLRADGESLRLQHKEWRMEIASHAQMKTRWAAEVLGGGQNTHEEPELCER